MRNERMKYSIVMSMLCCGLVGFIHAGELGPNIIAVAAGLTQGIQCTALGVAAGAANAAINADPVQHYSPRGGTIYFRSALLGGVMGSVTGIGTAIDPIQKGNYAKGIGIIGGSLTLPLLFTAFLLLSSNSAHFLSDLEGTFVHEVRNT